MNRDQKIQAAKNHLAESKKLLVKQEKKDYDRKLVAHVMFPDTDVPMWFIKEWNIESNIVSEDIRFHLQACEVYVKELDNDNG